MAELSRELKEAVIKLPKVWNANADNPGGG